MRTSKVTEALINRTLKWACPTACQGVGPLSVICSATAIRLLPLHFERHDGADVDDEPEGVELDQCVET